MYMYLGIYKTTRSGQHSSSGAISTAKTLRVSMIHSDLWEEVHEASGVCVFFTLFTRFAIGRSVGSNLLQIYSPWIDKR